MFKTRSVQAAGVGLVVAAVVAVGCSSQPAQQSPRAAPSSRTSYNHRCRSRRAHPSRVARTSTWPFPPTPPSPHPTTTVASTSSNARRPTDPPTHPSSCDGNTLQNGALVNTDGSFTISGYTVYALPDSLTLGEAPGRPRGLWRDGGQRVHPVHREQPKRLHQAPPLVPTCSSSRRTPTDGGNPGDGSPPATTVPASTSLSTSLSGGGQSGASISVPTGTAVTDTATLSGTNASTATGTVTYNVYTDSGCTTLAPGGGGSAETITTPGTLPASSPVTLSSAGTYYWGVSYSGDTNNETSTSTCGTAGEVGRSRRHRPRRRPRGSGRG